MKFAVLIIGSLVPSLARAFLPTAQTHPGRSSSRILAVVEDNESSSRSSQHKASPSLKLSSWISQPALASATAALCLTVATAAAGPAWAVSGGGLDYANLDITGRDFSDGNYKGKDFTQVIAKTTSFKGSNLQGCRFYKAYLVATDFTKADLRGASLEDTSLDDAVFTDANVAGAYFSASILDAKSLENVDFTDAQLPVKTLPQLCMRDDVKGTNPTTGVDTRDSLMCP